MLKQILFSLMFSLLINNTIHANLLSDSNTIFNWGEDNFSKILSPVRPPIQFIDGWRYRYYKNTDTYLGVNDQGEVYLLGTVTNSALNYIDTVENLLKTIQNNVKNNSKLISIGNLNQCIELPLGQLDKSIKGAVEVFGVNIGFLISVLETNQPNTVVINAIPTLPAGIEIDIKPVTFNITYEIFPLSGQNFRVVSNASTDNPIPNIEDYIIPINWCKGMKWQTKWNLNRDNNAGYKAAVVSIDDSVILLDGTTRQAVQVAVSEINGTEPTVVVWLDTETGYPIKGITNNNNSVTVSEIISK